MDLLQEFRRRIACLGLPQGTALVAVSGGPDSVALLDLLVQSRDVHGLVLIVAHLDHGIHPDSAPVAARVRSLAESYGLPAHIGRLALGGDAGETTARARRYAWLESLRGQVGAELIFTAHHADDQVETVLMRVLAGSGPAGLAGMAEIRGRLARPLLTIPRAELIRHLAQSGRIAWLDPANQDTRHLRSWIRTELLPILRLRLPKIDSSLLRMSRQAARDRAAWDALLDALPGLELRTESEGISVAASSLGGYDSPLTQAVIFATARRAGCRLGPSRVGRVLALLRSGASGARAPLGDNWIAELAFGRLLICRASGRPNEVPWQLEGRSGQGEWGRWRFQWEPAPVPDQQTRIGTSAWFDFGALTVRGWAPGERLRPLGATGRRLVVRCFQEMRVPRTRRGSWPVVVHNGEIVWIPGVCRSDALLPARGTEALRVDAEYA